MIRALSVPDYKTYFAIAAGRVFMKQAVSNRVLAFGAMVWADLRAALDSFAERLLLLTPLRRIGLAFVLGALSALAMPPVSAFYALFLTLPGLVMVLDAAHASVPRGRFWRAGFAIGWGFGFGYFLASLWWLGVAFTIEDQFLYLMPLGVVGLPAGLALFFAVGTAISALFWSQGVGRLAALALGIGISEALRMRLLTGFAWNGLAQGLADHLVLAQGIAVIGAEAMGVVLVVLAASPVTLLGTSGQRMRLWPPAAALLVLVVLALFGLWRLAPTGGVRVDYTRLPLVADIRLRLVQPNASQQEKHQNQNGQQVLGALLTLSDKAKGAHAQGLGDVTHLFWPESPLPFVLERNARALDTLKRALPTPVTLVTGSVRALEGEGGKPRYTNAMQVVSQAGILGTYDKVHLVPFGEYLPFADLFAGTGLEPFVRQIGGFTPGQTRGVLDVPGLPPILPAICFEAIFSHELAPLARQTRLIVSVTNDAWFGTSFGPYQHFAQARLRAIEFGQPLVRVANSGISALVDPYGRVLAHLPLNVADVLDAPLPQALPSTVFLEIQEFAVAVLLGMLLVFALGARRR